MKVKLRQIKINFNPLTYLVLLLCLFSSGNVSLGQTKNLMPGASELDGNPHLWKKSSNARTQTCDPNNTGAASGYCAPANNCVAASNKMIWSQTIDVNSGAHGTIALYSNNNPTYHITGYVIPSSTYNSLLTAGKAISVNISDAVSYDGYADRPNSASQPNEKWRVQFKKDGVVLWNSNWTGDIIDGVKQDYWRGALGSSPVFPNGIDEIRIQHWWEANQSENRDIYNSVKPSSICIEIVDECGCANNLVSNSSYENGTTNWNWSGGTLQVGTYAAACGTNSGQFQITNATSNYVSQTIETDPITGTEYDVKVFAGSHEPASYNHQVGIVFLDANYAAINSTSNVIVPVEKDLENNPTGPQLYTFTGTAPAGTKYVQVYYGGSGDWIKTDGWCVTKTVPCTATADAGGSNTVCQGSGALTLSGATVGGNATTGAWSIVSGGGTLSSTAQSTAFATVTYTPASTFSGTVTLRLTSNVPSGCSAAGTDTRTITVTPSPTVNAGGPNTVCQGSGALTLSGATIGGSATTGAWSIVSGGGTLSSTAQSTAFATVTYTPASTYSGTVTLRLTTNAPAGCAAVNDTRDITVTPSPTVNAGGPNTVCQGSGALTLSGATIGGSATTGAWSIVSGGGTLSSTAQSTAFATVTYTPASTYSGTVTLRLTTNAPAGCAAVNDTRDITVTPSPTVNAGGPNTVCQGSGALTLSGATIGGSATTGAWSIVSGGGTLSSTAQSTAFATVTYTPASTYSGTVTLRLTTNAPAGCAAVNDTRDITVTPSPTVNAGGPNTVCQGSGALTLSGATIGGSATTGAWSIVSGGGTLSSTAQSTAFATVTYTPASTYSGTVTLRLTTNAPAGCAAVNDTRDITVTPSPTVNAGGPNTVCQSSGALTLSGATIGGSATTGAWSIVSGGGTLSSTAQSTAFATVTYTPASTYSGTVTLRLTTNAPAGCAAVNDTRDITVTPSPTVNAGGPNTVCQGSGALTLSGATIGGSATTGAWSIVSGGGTLSSTAQSTAFATVTYTPASTYSGTVTLRLTTNAPAGCAAVNDTRDITVTPSPTVNAGGPNTVCQGSGALTLSGATIGGSATTGAWSIVSGGGTLSSTAQSTAFATVTYTPASTYSGTVTLRLTTNAPAGCAAVNDTRDITVTPSPTVNAGGPNTVCQSSGALTLSGATIGGSATTGAWSIVSGGGTLSSTAQSTAFATVTYTPASTYSGTVTLRLTTNAPAGCAAVNDTRDITVTPSPTVNAGGPNTVCQGSGALTLSGATIGGSATTGAWSIVSGGGTLSSTAQSTAFATVTYTPASTYSGTVTLRLTTNAPAGCASVSDDRSITVNALPVVSIAGNNTVCSGVAATFTASGATSYVWSSGETTASISKTAAGTYTVTGTDANGCTASASRTLTVNALPVVTIAGNNTVCSGVAATFTASGATTYSWSSGETTASISKTAAGTYTVTGTDANGCTASASRTLTVNALPVVTIAGNNTVCSGVAATFTASGATTYSWSSGETTASISKTAAGTYTVTGTNAAGCTASASRTLTVNALPVVTIAGNNTVCSGVAATFTASGATTYSWSSGETTASISKTAAGTYTVTGTNAAGCTASASRTLTVNALPVVSIAGNNTVCTGVAATFTASGATSYVWSSGETTASISKTAAGTYTVTGTDANGCTASASRTLTVNALPVVTIAGNNTVCSGVAATFTASGATTYSWSSGETTASISKTAAGTYTVTGTDANGCTASASRTLTVNALPVVSIAGNNTVCSGVAATFTASGATTYSWSSGETTASISKTAAGTYTVTGTNAAGCTASASRTLTVNALPVVTIAGNNTVCSGVAATFTASGATTYSWSSGETTASISKTAAGTYTVTGTDANGCTASASRTLTVNALPVVTIAGNNTVCSGVAATFTASGATTYSWSSGETTASISKTAAGTYTVTGTNAAGCTASASRTLTVNALPVVTIAGNNTVCSGVAATFTASGASTYSWSSGETTASISKTAAGTYTVTGTDANGCTASASRTLTVNALPVVTIAGNNTVCSGVAATFTASGATSYVWSSGETTASISKTAAGTYTVTGTDANGCTASASRTLTLNALPVVTIAGNNTVCSGVAATFTASGATTYSWSSGETTASISKTAAGTYTVTGTDANGCTASASRTLTVNALPVVTIAGNNTVCSGVAATFTASGATTYSWSSGETTASISKTAAGTYTVTGTNAAGCTASASRTLTVNALPVVTIAGNNTVCSGVAATFTASGASTYSWSSGETTASISKTAAGTYTVTGTDANGCTASASRTLTVNALPVVTIAGNNTVCSGVAATFTASGATTYSWSSGETTASISKTAAGTYTVTGTNAAGCTSSASRTLTVNALPVVTIAGNNTVCSGVAATFTASGATSYVWSSGETTASISKTAAGTYTVTGTDANGCTASASRTLTLNALPVVTIAGNNTVCSGVAATFTASGATTYSWSSGETTASISKTAAGTYTVTGTDANGCTASASRTLTVNALPVVTIAGNNTVCSGVAATFTASGATTYSWSSGETTASISKTAAGTYTVTGTDANGCTASASRTLTVNALPVVSIAGNNTVCSGVAATFTASGATTYSWSSGETTASISKTAAGTYTVTGTNAAGCTASASRTLTVNALPVVTIAGNNTVCSGVAATFTASGATTYSWSSGETTASISKTAAGTYTVTGTDANGCTASASRTLTVNALPVVTIAGNNTVCSGVAATFTASGATSYVWSSGETTASISKTAAGTYTVTGTDANGCTASASRTLTLNALPVVTIAGNNTVCSGVAATFTASGATTYSWSSGETTASISKTAAGTYTVTGTDANGCTASASRTLTVNALPVVTIAGNNTVCSGVAATFTASGATTYSWSSGETTASISKTAAGTYTVTGTDANGCTASASRTLTVNALPVVTIAGNNTVCSGVAATFTASGASTYSWSSGETTASISKTAAGTYTVTGTDANGCTASASRTLTVNALPVVTIAGNNTVCSGVAATFTASGATTYSWSSGETTASISKTAAGTYTVTGTNAAGCTASASRTLTVNALPVVSIAGNNTVCSGVAATFTASGATSYVWSSGETTASISKTAAGTYTVTGTDANGCTASASRTLTLNALPVVTIAGNNTVCSGVAATFTASGATTYSWSSGETTASISKTAAGTYTVTGTDANGCTASASRTLTVNALPVVTIAGNNTVCSGVAATFTASGATTYSWSSGETTASISKTAAGTYTVTGTDANGCTASASRTLTVNALPVVSIAGNNTVCSGVAATFTASGATTYSWSSGETTASISKTAAGTYTVTGTNAAGCTASASRTLTVNALPVVTIAGNNTVCSGVAATFTASGATTYSWSSGETTASISKTAAGTYTVTGTDANGCTASASRTLTVNALPVVSIAGNNTVCSGVAATFTASGATSYVWSSGETTASISKTAAGTYTVTGTDANGCTASASRTLTVNALPVVSIAGNNTVCSGVAATFTASGATTYSWSSGETTASISKTAAGTYTVTGTNAAGCTASASRTLTVNALPVVTIAGNNTVCSGVAATFTASGATTYSWSSGETTASISKTAAGTYTVTGTDANGCTASASRTLTVNALPVVTIAGNNTVCSGVAATFTASGASTYSWSSGETTASISKTAAGTYTVTGTNAAGCTASASRTLTVNALPVVSIAGNNTVCSGVAATFTASGATSYVWSSGETTASISKTAAGTYTVTGTDANGCTASASRTLTVNALPVVTIAGNNTVCSGVAATFTASGATTYSWSSGETTASISKTAAGTYTVTGTDANGCTASASRTLTVNALPNTPSVAVTNPTCLTATGSFTITSQGAGYTYSINNGAFGTTLSQNGLAAGSIIKIRAKDTNGCESAELTITIGNTIPKGSIGDFTFVDANYNGTFDSGETKLSGVEVKLFTVTNGQVSTTAVASKTTDSNGNYLFSDLCEGTYVINFANVNGYTRTKQNNTVGDDPTDSDADVATGNTGQIVLSQGENDLTNDAGYYIPASLGNLVFEDKNANGIQDGGEPGIAGVVVTLSTGASKTTDANGNYSFTDLTPGSYDVTFAKPTGFTATTANSGTDDAKDSDANTASGKTGIYTLVSGENNPTIDAGFYKTTSLGDFVFEDKNVNGVQDNGEPGIAGVTVTLSNGQTTTTGSNGEYQFTNLAPGTYDVTFTKPTGFIATVANGGTDDAKDSDANVNTGKTGVYTLASNENNPTIDAGFYKLASLGDVVFEDKNANGVQDAGETGITGVVVTLSNGSTTTTSATGTYSFTNLTPGTYDVTFTKPAGYTASPANAGTDDAKDSDASTTNGKTGSYTLASGENNLTVDAGFYKLASLGDVVFEDKNANGVQDAGEPGIAGVVVTLSTGATKTTDANGVYSFTDLTPGTYDVTFTKPAGYTASPANAGTDDAKDSDASTTNGKTGSYTLASGENNLTVDAGFYKTASLGDVVFEDKNANGIQDAGETGIAGVVVTLSTGATKTTDANGVYSFTDLTPGTYDVTFTKPAGYTASPANAGTDDAKDSDASTTNGKTGSYTLASGENNLTVDAGFYKLASLGDVVFEDKNANGVQDAGEPGIAGVVVTLSTGATKTTDANGVYSFTDLTPGTYDVTFTKPAGYTASPANAGTDDAKDSDASTTNGKTGSYTLASGENNLTVDAGFYKTASLGDVVFEDKNANGIQDAGETGIAGVVVTLSTGATKTTDANGVYSFTDLTPGTYDVTFTKPAGYTASPANAGTDDAKDSDASTTNGKTGSYTLASGENNLTVDAGFYKLASLGDVVFEDKNANGIQDAGETGIAGVVVTLSTGATKTTDANGVYSFTDLTPGTYDVTFTKPAGYTASPANAGTDDAKDSDASTTNGKTGSYTLASGENNLTVDAGFYKLASLGDVVFEDKNANGVQDAGETGITGVVVTLSNGSTTTTSATGTYSFTNLTPGTYDVTFTKPAGYTASPANAGTDDAKDSDASTTNGKTGSYTLASGENNLTVDAGFYKLASLGDVVFEDKNANGVQDAGETGIAGVVVTLSTGATKTTDANGVYSFTDLTPGTYDVTFTKPAGYTASPANAGTDDAKDSDARTTNGKTGSYTLASGENNLTVDAGFYKLASLGDVVFEDKNANGIQDAGETGIAGVVVTLSTGATKTTDANGVYSFTDLTPGTYDVTFTKPAGYTASPANAGTDDAKDSDASTTNGKTGSYTLASGENNLTVDAGFYKLASLGDVVFEDKNANGIQDAGETGIAGVVVTLSNGSTKTTDANGVYSFTDLTPGTYDVTFTKPAGYTASPANAGTDDAKDSDANTASGKTGIFNLASGENNTTIDAGFYKTTSLGDFVFEDKNVNGVQDNGEPGIAGVTVTLSNGQTTTTGSNGEYQFTNLAPGTYDVTFTKPTGFIATVANGGTDDAKDSDANVNTGKTGVYTLASNENNPTIDAGFYKLASLGDVVFEDKNANGIQDAGETGIAGVVVTLSNGSTKTTDANGVYSFTDLTPGTYDVTFTKPAGYTASPANAGTDDAKDSDASTTNGKTGSYTLTSGENNTTVDAGFYKPASLGNFVFEDKNGNGKQDAGELGIPGVLVTLSNGQTETTDGNGAYQFTNLTPGTYDVTFTKPAGYNATTANAGTDDAVDSDANVTTGKTESITLTSGESNQTVDAGFIKPATLGNIVFEDKNANGIQDAGETGIAGVVVTLSNGSTKTTDANGVYSFTDLTPGTYDVTFTKPAGYTASPANAGTDDAKDSDANTTTGKTGTYILSSGETNNTVDAGFYKPASLGDVVFEDKNANGVQDAGEPGIAGVVVTLSNGATKTTDANGVYSFTDLTPGTYDVTFTKPSGFTTSPANSGTDDAKDSDADIFTGKTPVYTLASGDNNTSIDAGYYKLGKIGDLVFEDKNANGIQDAGEPGIKDVVVTLSNGATTTTATDGTYSFTNLTPGTYDVTFTKPAGYTASPANTGTDDAKDSDASTTNGKTGTITIASGETNNTVDAGFYKPATIGDKVFDDKNVNGIQDAGEPGIAGVVVTLSNGTSKTTDANGVYSFTDLTPGTYDVTFTKPAGYTASPANAGTDDAKDSDANATNGKTGTITVTSGETNNTVDAGFFKKASIGNYTFYDANVNGKQDPNEWPAKDIFVELLDVNGNVLDTRTTGSDGIYNFTDLMPGDYKIRATHPNGFFRPTIQNAGTDDEKDSDVNPSPTDRTTSTITLVGGEVNNSVDIGFYRAAEFNISDPCICRNDATNLVNGRYDEIVSVDATPGQTWTIITQTGMYLSTSPAPPAAPNLVPLGTPMVETPAGSGHFEYKFQHVDAIGYSVSVGNGLNDPITGTPQQASISNKCFYPNPVFQTVLKETCLTDPPIVLTTNQDPAVPGTVKYYMINGTTRTQITNTNAAGQVIINPATMQAGTFKIEVEYIPTDPALCTENQIIDANLVIKSCSGPLSVNLISFNAKNVNGNAQLDWKVSEEKDFNKYVIERSINGKEFLNIGDVKGVSKTSYSYVDTKPYAGLNYYRLKMVNNNGTFDYSKIAAIDFGQPQDYALVENPATNGVFNVNTNAVNPTFELRNVTGATLPLTINKVSGLTYKLTTKNYNAGIYFLSITSKGKVITKKVYIP